MPLTVSHLSVAHKLEQQLRLLKLEQGYFTEACVPALAHMPVTACVRRHCDTHLQARKIRLMVQLSNATSGLDAHIRMMAHNIKGLT